MQSSSIKNRLNTCPCEQCGNVTNKSAINFVTNSNNGALHFKSQHIDAKVDNCIATISIKQVFVNLTDSAIEGTYLFPIDTNLKSTAVSEIKFQLGNKEIISKVTPKQQAQ